MATLGLTRACSFLEPKKRLLLSFGVILFVFTILQLTAKWLNNNERPRYTFTRTTLPDEKFKEISDSFKTKSLDSWEKEIDQLMRNQKLDKFTLVAALNMGHLELALNWIASLRVHKHKHFVLLAMDIPVYRALLEYGLEDHIALVPPQWLGHDLSEKETIWGDDYYKQLVEAKMRIQLTLLDRGHWVFFSDVDVAFLNDHVQEHVTFIFKDCSDDRSTLEVGSCPTDIVYMSDGDYQDTSVNTGFWIARPTKSVKDPMREAIPLTKDKMYPSDQHAFNWVLQNKGLLFSKAYFRLDSLLYPNGLVYYFKGYNKNFGVQPMVLHANFISGVKDKRDLLRNSGCWYI